MSSLQHVDLIFLIADLRPPPTTVAKKLCLWRPHVVVDEDRTYICTPRRRRLKRVLRASPPLPKNSSERKTKTAEREREKERDRGKSSVEDRREKDEGAADGESGTAR
ncbi:hypothetical protein MTR_4g081310 [Medicago truncatula]|uniref:Uncharacterized protein n=1 Tax=Medicago truncatula TaxID=3880 RepID=G7JF27_MEDTR|nr:hypothetical protein MTR_4g081310 [Medicago truncatula]